MSDRQRLPLVLIFFFKQKTAYELSRDWSSDVCSSDLRIGWLAAFLYAACAALRLARFNSQVAQVDKRWFVGLASPAAAGLMASFVWTCHDMGLVGSDLRHAALSVTVVAGLLMVSRIRYTSFKGSGQGPLADRVPF